MVDSSTNGLPHHIETLRENPNQTYQELLNSIRDILSAGYSQRPQLSSSHPLDVESLFVC